MLYTQITELLSEWSEIFISVSHGRVQLAYHNKEMFKAKRTKNPITLTVLCNKWNNDFKIEEN